MVDPTVFQQVKDLVKKILPVLLSIYESFITLILNNNQRQRRKKLYFDCHKNLLV